MKNKIIAFIEHESQLKRLIQEYCSGVLVVAMTPEIDFLAGKTGREYVSIEDFYDSVDLMAEGSANFPGQEAFCEFLDNCFEKSFPGICSGGLFSSKWFLYLIKRERDSLFYKALIVRRVFERLKPERVICFVSGNESLVNLNDLTYWSDLSGPVVLSFAEKSGCEVLVQEEAPANIGRIKQRWNRDTSRTNYIQRRLKRYLKLANIIIKSVFYRLSRKSKLPVIAVKSFRDGLFDFEAAAEIWQKKGGRILDFRVVDQLYRLLPDRAGNLFLKKNGISEEKLELFWEGLKKNEDFLNWFRFEGVNCLPASEKWLHGFITKTVPWFIGYTRYLEELFKDKQVSVFIIGPVAAPAHIAGTVAAKRSGAIVINSQHGGIDSMLLPMYEYIDFRLADFSFRYGPEGEKVFSEEFNMDKRKDLARLASVGSVPIKKIFIKERAKPKKIPDKQRTLLYIPTGLIGDHVFFAWNFYPDIWYWRFLKSAFDLFREYPDIKVLFKEYPGDTGKNPAADYVRSENMGNIEFIPAGSPSEDNLGRADLIVIDFPSSALMGALCTRKPIVLFSDPRWLKMAEAGRVLLKKRVSVCVSQDEFLSDLRKWCEKPVWPEIEFPDDGYLKAFGIIDERLDPAEEQIRQINKILLEAGKIV